MKIDFNNVRIQACHAYDKLVRVLNSSEEYEGYMLVNPGDIEEHLNDLRMMIGAIAMSYEPDNEDIKNVYPDDYSMETFSFNNDEE